jgi:predicted dehydrogenase
MSDENNNSTNNNNDVIRVGLVGCGSRGTSAAVQALRADKGNRLVAIGDAFEDRLRVSLGTLNAEDVAPQVDVPPARRFVGFDAYEKVIANCDVVLLTTPPHFRPLHLKAAVDAGKHVFAEKPIAVDAPGVRSVLNTCEQAAQKNLSVVSGLCLRYHAGYRETVRRVHDGAIGDVLTLQANDYRGGIWVFPRKPGESGMRWQMRNWYYFTWLSGDFNVEQHVHNLDVCAWLMKDQYPVKAIGTGGRSARQGEEFGEIYDHFAVVYEYENGSRVYSTTRQQPHCDGDISVHAIGTKGRALLTEREKDGLVIRPHGGGEPWSFGPRPKDMYQVEHDELFASIRNGKPINNGRYMCYSTLMGIMGRLAAYTGKQVTWEQALNSQEDLTPPKYDWDLDLPAPPVAIPGDKKLV